MYTEFYKFREKPFSIVPDPAYLYLSSKHQMALTYLEYGLMDGIGFILMTGEIGTGKTTIIRKLLDQLPQDMEVALVSNTNVSPEQLLEMIIHEFELMLPPGSKGGMLDVLNGFLVEQYAESRRALLIVDEAQNLSAEALEEIRMLSNLQTDKEALLQILLVGQPGLRSRLQHPSLLQLSQRIAVSYHLAPLDLSETRAYIAHRLKVAGGEDENLFTSEALESIHIHSGGIPRTINILCDAALVYGFADELAAIDGGVITKVVRDKKEVGLFASAPGDEEVQSLDGVAGNGDRLFQRLQGLEGRVEKMSVELDRYRREGEFSDAREKDGQIQQLQRLLSEERSRSDVLLAQYHRLREKLHQLNRLLRTKGQHTTAQASAPKEQPNTPPQRKADPEQGAGSTGKFTRLLELTKGSAKKTAR
jgi:general secretion pathway protein A